jgi:hypothetical protein
MAIWHDDTYVGFQDDLGWHPATARSRARQPHMELETLSMRATRHGECLAAACAASVLNLKPALRT